MHPDSFASRATLQSGDTPFTYYRLAALTAAESATSTSCRFH